MELTEKELHCLARIIQAEESSYDAKCLYCKYAFECKREFERNGKVPFKPILKKIEQITGVNIFMSSETRTKEILSGSWIEDYPDLLECFRGMSSFEEQLEMLKSSDILKYEHQMK